MFALIRATGNHLKEVGSILWRCVYSVGLTLFGSVGLVYIPQVVECLRLVSQPGWNFPLFLVAVACWSLAAWYSARLTLGRVFEGSAKIDRADTAFVNAMRMWLPRLLAVTPGLVLALQFWRLGEYVLALADALTALALGVFVLKRRDWFADHFRDANGAPQAGVRFSALDPRTVRTVAVSIALTFALLLAIWWKPVEVTYYLTAPVLVCFAFASWILFGDLVLIYAFRQAGLPSMAALPLLLFVVFSLWNDNHAVSLVDGDDGPPLRRAAAPHLQAWLEARQASGELTKDATFPVFLVAAEGGGIRAAYWSAIVLTKLQDDSGARFGRHLLAISGVSGGSLAGAVLAGLMADARDGTLAAAPCARGNPATRFQTCARQVLRRDFLSPTVGYMFYPDMLQRFLPFAVPAADRARAMERAWRAGWDDAVGSGRLSQRFDRLWRGAADVEVPSLLLNATLVEGGNRLIASDLVIDGQFPDAYDAFDPMLDLRQMGLATAVHNSARFTYVSPAGTVAACSANGTALAACGAGIGRKPWGRVIDGGYFENSGVETVRDLLFAMRPVIRLWNRAGYRIEPVVLAISNSPGALAPSGKKDPRSARLDMTFLSEVLAPPLGLFNTRMARATLAVTAERRDMTALLPSDPERFLWFGMHTRNDTPLGWALADRTFDGMDDLLKPPTVQQLPFDTVLKKLAPPPPPPPP